MAFIKVVGLFDDEAALRRARADLIASGLATEATLRVEPEELEEDLQPHSRRPRSFRERLKELFGVDPDGDVSRDRPRRMLLVVTALQEQTESVKEVLRRNGARELRLRLWRWVSTGWDEYDQPAGLGFVEEEIVEEPRRQDAAAAAAVRHRAVDPSQPFTSSHPRQPAQ
jgi:hypothetical protein